MVPKKGRTPKWEKEDNRAKILLTLMKEPMSFTELLNALGLSRKTLSDHLGDLVKEKIIGRTRRNGKRVYEVVFDDEQTIRNELSSMNFEMLLKLISMDEDVDPVFSEVWKSFTDSLLKVIIYFKKRELMGERRLSAKELHIKVYEMIKSSAPPSVKKLMHVDKILKGLKEASESQFDDFDQVEQSLIKELKRRKKDEGKN